MIAGFKVRLINELYELEEKIEKLNTFMWSNEFDKISEEQALLIPAQLEAMKEYKKLLELRLVDVRHNNLIVCHNGLYHKRLSIN